MTAGAGRAGSPAPAKLTSFLAQLRIEPTQVKSGELALTHPDTEETLEMWVTASEIRDRWGVVTAVAAVLQNLAPLRELERRRVEQALFQGGCTNSITLLPEGSGVKTGVQFKNGNVYAPMAFNGSYNLAGCLQFKGWAQNSIKLSFDQEKQTVFGYVNVEGVNLEGVNPIANTMVTAFVQGAINQRVNPLVLVSEQQLSLMIPVKANNGAVKARAKDVRAEVLDGSLKLYLTYEFSGVKDGGGT
jgi:hypothetical protein